MEWFGLLGLSEGDFQASAPDPLRGLSARDVARGHGHNFEVYRNWLIEQGYDPDDMQ